MYIIYLQLIYYFFFNLYELPKLAKKKGRKYILEYEENQVKEIIGSTG